MIQMIDNFFAAGGQSGGRIFSSDMLARSLLLLVQYSTVLLLGVLLLQVLLLLLEEQQQYDSTFSAFGTIVAIAFNFVHNNPYVTSSSSQDYTITRCVLLLFRLVIATSSACHALLVTSFNQGTVTEFMAYILFCGEPGRETVTKRHPKNLGL